MDTLRDRFPTAPGGPQLQPIDPTPSDTLTGPHGLAPASSGAPAAPAIDVNALTEEVRQTSAFLDDVFAQVGRVVVGQRTCRARDDRPAQGGHCLIEGAGARPRRDVKRCRRRSTRRSRESSSRRSVTGRHQRQIIQNAHAAVTQKRGPLFANLGSRRGHLAPRGAVGLIEGAGAPVTIGDSTHSCGRFRVLATQNPTSRRARSPPRGALDRSCADQGGYTTAAEGARAFSSDGALEVPTQQVASIERCDRRKGRGRYTSTIACAIHRARRQAKRKPRTTPGSWRSE